jgi:hypothetical protein
VTVKPITLNGGQLRQLQATECLQLMACSTANASQNCPHGTAPSSPVNGDIWTTTAGIYVRINGSTVGPLGTSTGDFTGPGSSTTNHFVTFADGTGKVGKDSGLALDTDGTLAANSDARIPSQKAVKTYADAIGAAAVVTANAYTDAAVNGRSWKDAVRAATTANGTLATAFENGDVIDGVTLATGDRILLKDQSTATQNGIYIVAASGAPTRATDADSGAELVDASCYVSEGSTNADLQFTCTTNAPIVLGVTNLTFVQSGSGSTYTADGSTLQLVGTQFSIKASGVGTTEIAPDAVTLAKLVNASAQYKILARKSSGSGDWEECSLSELLDFVTSAAQGDLLYRGAATWSRLAAGTAGYVLQTGGTGANPSWAAATSIGAVTNNQITQPITTIFDGGTTVLVPASVAVEYTYVPYACTIIASVLFSDLSTTAAVDVWVDVEANYPPTVLDTIVAQHRPHLRARYS